MTNEGYLKLIEFEGEVFHAYRDSEGFMTIGIGHCIDERRGCGITRDMSRRMFDDDLARFTATARANFEWFDALDQVRQDVIVMMLFNVGLGGLKTFRLMLKAFGEHAWQDAAFQLSNSLWGRQVQLDRKKEMCSAIEYGRW